MTTLKTSVTTTGKIKVARNTGSELMKQLYKQREREGGRERDGRGVVGEKGGHVHGSIVNSNDLLFIFSDYPVSIQSSRYCSKWEWKHCK